MNKLEVLIEMRWRLFFFFFPSFPITTPSDDTSSIYDDEMW